eukprot:scaffold261211_cov30-Tisochrysis_lutea.AAC.1
MADRAEVRGKARQRRRKQECRCEAKVHGEDWGEYVASTQGLVGTATKRQAPFRFGVRKLNAGQNEDSVERSDARRSLGTIRWKRRARGVLQWIAVELITPSRPNGASSSVARTTCSSVAGVRSAGKVRWLLGLCDCKSESPPSVELCTRWALRVSCAVNSSTLAQTRVTTAERVAHAPSTARRGRRLSSGSSGALRL